MRSLNLALLWVGAFLAGTGFLMAYRLPHGPSGRGLQALGLDRHDWAELHTAAAWCALALGVLHLAMNWNWVRVVAHRRTTWRAALGLGVAVALALGLWLQPVERMPREGRERRGSGAVWRD